MSYLRSPTSLAPSSPWSTTKTHSSLSSSPESLQRLSPERTKLLITARSYLYTLLTNHNLNFFRHGFPFRSTYGYDSMTNASRYHVSYDGYEISEDINVPLEYGGPHARVLMTLSYTPPTTGKTMTVSSLENSFCWTIYLSTPPDHRISRTSPLRNLPSQRASVARVAVDPSILNPSNGIKFGQAIINNPGVLTHALSTSLELGVAITILPTPSSVRSPFAPPPYVDPSDPFCQRGVGQNEADVVYVCTNNEGEQEVLFGVGSINSSRPVVPPDIAKDKDGFKMF